MTPTSLTFYFDFGSPFAYLGATQVERLAEEAGAELVYRPILLGGLFRSIGTPDVPLFAMPEVKQRHQLRDLERYAELWKVPYSFPSTFPVRTVQALRMVLQLPSDQQGGLVMALFRAFWADGRDIGQSETLLRICSELGLDGTRLLKGCSDPEIKARLRKGTEEAERAGVFGVPTFVVEHAHTEEPLLFWGQDRIPLVERALSGWCPKQS